MMRIKKEDLVLILSGKDKGKKGIVIDILNKTGKVKVKDIAKVKKHFKAKRQGQVSGILETESFIDLSKVMPICQSCSVPTRIVVKIDNDKKNRACGHCQAIM